MHGFKEYVTEMAAQQGFQYEKNAATALKKLNAVPKNFTPAGAGKDVPDLILQKGKLTAGCELKISAASAGSLVLKFEDKKGWHFGEVDKADDEKIFIRDLAMEVGLFDLIKKTWKELPLKGSTNKELLNQTKDLTKREKYERDKAAFPDIKGTIPATKIEQYYNKKKTYYVNVGTHGFYLLGRKNPLGFKGIPEFGRKAIAKFRCRVQYKGNDNYQFTFEMNFTISSANKSPYNIAPLPNAKNVTVGKINLDWWDL